MLFVIHQTKHWIRNIVIITNPSINPGITNTPCFVIFLCTLRTDPKGTKTCAPKMLSPAGGKRKEKGTTWTT